METKQSELEVKPTAHYNCNYRCYDKYNKLLYEAKQKLCFSDLFYENKFFLSVDKITYYVFKDVNLIHSEEEIVKYVNALSEMGVEITINKDDEYSNICYYASLYKRITTTFKAYSFTFNNTNNLISKIILCMLRNLHESSDQINHRKHIIVTNFLKIHDNIKDLNIFNKIMLSHYTNEDNYTGWHGVMGNQNLRDLFKDEDIPILLEEYKKNVDNTNNVFKTTTVFFTNARADKYQELFNKDPNKALDYYKKLIESNGKEE